MANDERHQRMTARLRSERGVSLIHVAVSIFVLMGFAAFVVDHGVMMVARGQAQNVADAAAISGVTTRVKDELSASNPTATPTAITNNVITWAVNQGTVFGGTPANIGRIPIFTCPLGVPSGAFCVEVQVFRDGTNSSTPLPVYFAPLFGMPSQNTRATATAVAVPANGTRCLKPWLIPDKWQEDPPPTDPRNSPDDYNPEYGDVYTPYDYTTNTPGTGYSVADIGTTVVLHGGPGSGYGPSFYFSVGANSGALYQDAIENCRITRLIGQTITSAPGGMQGPTNHGVTNLTANGPVNVLVGMFSPQEWLDLGKPTGNFTLTIVNIIGIRVISSNPQGDITGEIVGGIGEDIGVGPEPTGAGALTYAIKLVR